MEMKNVIVLPSSFHIEEKNARSPIYSLILKRKTITLTPLNGSFRNPTTIRSAR